MFAEYVFMDDVIRSLDGIIAKSADNWSRISSYRNKAAIGQFFEAFKEVQDSERNGCPNARNANARGHKTKQVR